MPEAVKVVVKTTWHDEGESFIVFNLVSSNKRWLKCGIPVQDISKGRTFAGSNGSKTKFRKSFVVALCAALAIDGVEVSEKRG